MLLTVVHLDGSKKGQTETFQQPIISVGRDPSSVLLFDPVKDQDVSTRHAQFVIQGTQLMIQDMGSRNGTFVNGQRVGNQPSPVPDGAVVQFGDKGPKLQISFRALPSAPGKKTQMIADLEGKLQQQQKAGTKTLACTVLLILLVAGGGFGGFFFWQKTQKRKAEEAAVS
ncbi:MAG TPA: FHA domain-containing protein, partial [Planctomycetota bacterium]|nr:FHA domain-containing protein [Planctomycetota bacterium]